MVQTEWEESRVRVLYGLPKRLGTYKEMILLYPTHDLTGNRFGNLVVIKKAGIQKQHTKWLCKCDCGIIKEILGSNLVSGHTTSCGCVHRKISKAIHTIHGKSREKIYHIWEAMKRRCDNPHTEKFSQYGGRGIKYINKWKEFSEFYQWAISAGYKIGLSIDRINVNGNYEPSNCRWVTMKDQQSNKRNNHLICYNGKTKTLSQWAELLEIYPSSLLGRISRHGIDGALSMGVNKGGTHREKYRA